MNVLILGASGMLGSQLFLEITNNVKFNVFGTIRDIEILKFFPKELINKLILVGDLCDKEELDRIFKISKPDVVINCISLNRAHHDNFEKLIKIYSLLPFRLAGLCRLNNSRLILISSDAVFSGKDGDYNEFSIPDAVDRYGISKILGEINGEHIVTIRTSIIGHELRRKDGLVEWILTQDKVCKGYTRAIYSGLPAVVVAKIIQKFFIDNELNLVGIYNLASQPISKFDLLALIAKKYQLGVKIIPDEAISINRSLCAKRFTKDTGCTIPAWPMLIDHMYDSYVEYKYLISK